MTPGFSRASSDTSFEQRSHNGWNPGHASGSRSFYGRGRGYRGNDRSHGPKKSVAKLDKELGGIETSISLNGETCQYRGALEVVDIQIPMDRESEESTSQSVSNATTGDKHSSGVMTMTKGENRACPSNGGMSKGDDSGNNVMVRIYDHGETSLFEKMEKVKAFECMSHLGQGPRLLGRFPNGHLEEVLNARTLLGPDLHAPSISQNIGVTLHIEGLSHPHLWECLRDWLEKSKWNFAVISLVDEEDDGLLYAPFKVAEKGRMGASSRDEGIV
ncbi:hypothetical protein SUGI_0102350 [Cryptomeria japonica]|nr:hypothetical protein SUGI_0102350 [Cryptomeria japonica]